MSGLEKLYPSPPAPSDRSRARRKKATGKKAKRGNAEVKANRVKECMRLMASGIWVNGRSGPSLAAKWKVDERTVQNYAGEASRRIHDLVDGDPELKARVMSSIESVASDAHDLAVLARKGIAKDDKGNVKPRSVGDVVQAASKALQVKLDALKLFADVSGAKSPSKHQVETNIGELIAAAASQAERECAGQSDGPAPVSALES